MTPPAIATVEDQVSRPRPVREPPARSGSGERGVRPVVRLLRSRCPRPPLSRMRWPDTSRRVRIAAPCWSRHRVSRVTALNTEQAGTRGSVLNRTRQSAANQQSHDESDVRRPPARAPPRGLEGEYSCGKPPLTRTLCTGLRYCPSTKLCGCDHISDPAAFAPRAKLRGATVCLIRLLRRHDLPRSHPHRQVERFLLPIRLRRC